MIQSIANNILHVIYNFIIVICQDTVRIIGKADPLRVNFLSPVVSVCVLGILIAHGLCCLLSLSLLGFGNTGWVSMCDSPTLSQQLYKLILALKN